MKKKIFSSLFMMVALAMVTTTFTACGGDDEDDNNGRSTTIGVHRIDVHFDDNIGRCHAISIFYGLREDGSFSNLYENGTQLPLDATSHTWYSEEIRDFSISTEDKCGAIVASINVTTPNMIPLDKDVTVTTVGYINGKRLKSQVFTLPAGRTSMTAIMTTSDDKLESEVTM